MRVRECVASAEGTAVVTDLVDGVALRRLLAEGGPLTPAAALVVLRDALCGLRAAATAAFGEAWDREGRRLAERAGRLALLFPLAGGLAGAAPLTERS